MIIDPFLNNPNTLYFKKFMSDLFMHNHQSALDSFMEDKAIQDLEDAGIYPVPDNDAILENLYEEVKDEFPDAPDTVIEYITKKRFDQLPEPGDYDEII